MLAANVEGRKRGTPCTIRVEDFIDMQYPEFDTLGITSTACSIAAPRYLALTHHGTNACSHHSSCTQLFDNTTSYLVEKEEEVWSRMGELPVRNVETAAKELILACTYHLLPTRVDV
jgi:hypothetical protein